MSEMEGLKEQKEVEIIQLSKNTWKVIEGKRIIILPNYRIVVY
jgi:hypothetical protein